MLNGISTILNVSTILRMTTVTTVGAIIGKVRPQKTSHRDDVSRRAYSKRSSDNPCSAARKTIRQNGVHCQMSTPATASSDQSGDDSHGIACRPMAVRKPLMGPLSWLKIVRER